MKTLPHILFIASWYPHDENPTHGVFIKRHAECVAQNHKVTVVFAKSSGNVLEPTISINEKDNLTEVVILYPKIKSSVPLLKEFLKFNAYNNAIYKAVEIARQEQEIDLVHLQVIFPACIPTLNIIQQLHKPLLITEHWTGYAPEDGSYNGWLKKYYTKKIISKAQTVVVISGYLKNTMQQCGLHANYHVIQNIVDTDVFSPQQKTKDNITKFIHVSSLDDKQKNVSGIIRAFEKAYFIDKNIQLTIIGESENKKNLLQLARQLVVNDAITFIGRLPETELAHEINKHDALVMFSNYETFCLAIAETLSCGKPVITTAVGGIEEYMNPTLGITIEPKNEEELMRAFLTFAKNKIAYNAITIREFALKQFNKEHINKQFTELYKEVLNIKN